MVVPVIIILAPGIIQGIISPHSSAMEDILQHCFFLWHQLGRVGLYFNLLFRGYLKINK